jgi:ATP synthase protein I
MMPIELAWLRARSERDRNILFWIGFYGPDGWAFEAPTLLGFALGRWVGRACPAQPAPFTFSFLQLGVALGCLNAQYWIKRKIRHD